MKTKLIAAIIPLSMLAAGHAFAATNNCSIKINQIQTQIDFAKKAGNTYQIAGLEKALREAQQHCTDAGQNLRAEQKVRKEQENVSKAQQEIAKTETDLREAQARGDAKKIEKTQKKLSEKQDKLREKMEDLRSAQADLAALKG